MSRKKKRSELREFNKALKLNGQKPVNMKEFEDLEKFKVAYQMEELRLGKSRKRNLVLLVLIGVSALLCGLFGEYEWICDILILMIE